MRYHDFLMAVEGASDPVALGDLKQRASGDPELDAEERDDVVGRCDQYLNDLALEDDLDERAGDGTAIRWPADPPAPDQPEAAGDDGLIEFDDDEPEPVAAD